MKVYVCTEGESDAQVGLTSTRYPTCPQGQGSWIAVSELQASPFTTSLTLDDVAALLSAAALVLAVAWGFKQVISFTRNR